MNEKLPTLFEYYKDALARARRNVEFESLGEAHFKHLEEVRPEMAVVIEKSIFNPSSSNDVTHVKFEWFCKLIEQNWYNGTAAVREKIEQVEWDLRIEG